MNRNTCSKYIYKDHLGNKSGYYIGYTSIYTDKVFDTEIQAIRNAMKRLGGMEYISELRFDLNCKSFTKNNAFYKSTIGEIDNFSRGRPNNRPIYKTYIAGTIGNVYLLSKDGRKIKLIKN